MAASHKEVKSILVGTGVSGHAGSDCIKKTTRLSRGFLYTKNAIMAVLSHDGISQISNL